MSRLDLAGKVKRLLIAASIAAFSFLGTTISPSSSALALCSGYSCDGKSPVTTGCSTGAVTMRTKAIYDEVGGWGGQIATLRLRYSPACDTVWSQTILATGSAFLDGHQFDIEPQWPERTDSVPPSVAGQMTEYDYNLSDGQSAYSMMFYLPDSSSDGIGAFACTNIFMYERPGLPNFSGGGFDCTSSWNGDY